MKNPILTQFQALNEIKIALQEVSRLVEKYNMRKEITEDEYRIFNNDCEDFLAKIRIRMDRISPHLSERTKHDTTK